MEQYSAGSRGSSSELQQLQAIKTPKKSPLMLRMVVLVIAMICGGLFILSSSFNDIVKIAQKNTCTLLNIQQQQIIEQPLPTLKPIPQQQNCSQSKTHLHFHYPKPQTYTREECKCNPVRMFAIISMQRSGSGWFETLLNNHTNVSSNGEIFGSKDRRTNASMIYQTLDKIYTLDWFTSASKNQCSAAFGFKWMLNQGVMQFHQPIVEYFNKRGASIVFLFRRNILRRRISLLANTYDKEARLLNGTHKSHTHSSLEAQILASYKPRIEIKSLHSMLRKEEQMMERVLGYFNSTRYIVLYYEDIVNNRTKLQDVQDFLTLPHQNLTSGQVKIHSGHLSNQIDNWDEVKQALQGTSYERFLHSDYKRRRRR